MHHTVGSIFERMHRYEQAAAAYNNYINLLPNKDRSDKAAWSRSQVRFLKSFGETRADRHRRRVGRAACTPWTSGSSTTRSSSRRGSTAAARRTSCSTPAPSRRPSRARPPRRRRVRPITYTLSAGVGEVGLRGLQLGRLDALDIGTLKLQQRARR